jgi:CheY-like chemotaxis protein
VLERVFEPFFTTKAAGKGTGLGLSQVFGYVRQSEGEIAIASVEGKGTEVSLYLPRFAGQPAAVADAAEPTPEVAAHAGESILLVEDDARVLAATTAALGELGYRPVPCEGGAAALALLEARPDIRLVVTDVVMPGMTGPELVAEIRARWPALGVLFVSGYVGEAGDAASLAGAALLRKPFTIAALGRAVTDALARLDEAEALSAPPPAPRAAAAG